MEADLDLAWRAFCDGLPEPDTEYRFDAGRRWRFDRAWPEYRVAVEVDGGQWAKRGGRHNTDGDRIKLNEAAAQGWLVLRFSHDLLKGDPESCMAQLERALRGRMRGAI